jgi:D-glycero-D-manno-heptose 1,7-bisphosphate phosphatase
LKLIILDRDGTINVDSDNFVKNADEWIPLPNALNAIAALNRAGWHTVLATNQSGLGRGLFDLSALNAMHDKMNQLLKPLGGRMDAIFFCPHAPTDACDCRKPKSGLFKQIAERYKISLHGVPSVGDSLRDLQASAAMGCATHLVLTGKGRHQKAQDLPIGTQIHADLSAFAKVFLTDVKH